ncbi:hypothetical protein ACWGOQ_0022495 [Aquimarina sp. M1]
MTATKPAQNEHQILRHERNSDTFQKTLGNNRINGFVTDFSDFCGMHKMISKVFNFAIIVSIWDKSSHH